jgi:hypothetical protein
MAELFEEVALGTEDASAFECPFVHGAKEKTYGKTKNVMPKMAEDEKNDSEKLKVELRKTEPDKIADNYVAHHVIPGNNTWPKTRLLKWVDCRETPQTVDDNCGYDVNSAKNGIMLLGGCKCKTPEEKVKHTKNMMISSKRQYHDAHTAYSEFMVNVLDKVAAKLQNDIDEGRLQNCKGEHCQGREKGGRPYPPPVGLLNRVDGIVDRIREHLTASKENWKMPIFTSKFALMYHEGGTDTDRAREKMSAAHTHEKERQKSAKDAKWDVP